MNWKVTDKPSLPIEFAALAKHIRIDARDRDYVLDLQKSAVAYAERYLSMALMAQTITAVYDKDDVGDGVFVLPRGPVIQIVSVKDGAGADVAYERVRVGCSDRIRVATAPSHPFTVIYRAGHLTADDIDADIINAIRLHTATLYAWREDVSPSAATKVYNLESFYHFASANTGVG